MGKSTPQAGTDRHSPSTLVAALLGWAVPGMGHWWLGERGRGAIFFVVISVTFWAGVAVGGVRTTVTPKDNGAWIAAQLCVGPQALGALYLSRQIQGRPDETSFKAAWPGSNIAVVYAGVAGLLNLLVVIDCLAKGEAQSGSASVRSPPGAGGA
jgi:hypothetical protein